MSTGPAAATILHALRDLTRGEPIRLRVVGDSMAPLARDGSSVTVSRATLYWPGDVIAFAGAQGEVILHRVIGYRRGGSGLELVTQGDRARSADAPTGTARVIGRVCGGEGGASLARIPFRHRLMAAARFVRYIFRGLASRLR